MKVLFINCSDRGSTGQIIDLISEGLKARGDEAIFCYEIGAPSIQNKNRYRVSKWYEPGIYRRISNIISVPYGFAPFSTKRLLKLIKSENPDVVHIHCPNSKTINVYRLLAYLSKNKIKTVITNHCEMFYTGNCVHSYDCEQWKTGCIKCQHLREYVGPVLLDRTRTAWGKMKKALDRFDEDSLIITSVSKWVNERSSVSPLTCKFRNFIIENGVDTDVFCKKEVDKVSLCDKYNIPNDKKIVLFVSASVNYNKQSPKGAYFLNEIAKRINDDSILFVTVGPVFGDVDKISKNIINIGVVSSKSELSNLYNLADISIVLSKRETFSMVCAESLCCGTPVVGFKAGGPESVSIQEYSKFCEYGDINTFIVLLHNMISFKSNERAINISVEAQSRYNSNAMINSYVSLYKNNDL